jgi:hypothetical protein
MGDIDCDDDGMNCGEDVTLLELPDPTIGE